MNDCIFCKIIAGEIPSNPVYEDDQVIVIPDIAPKAPTHLLIIPKKHIEDVRSLENDQQAAAVLRTAQQLSQQKDNIPFKLVINNGHQAGQRVYHLHCHFLAGEGLPEFL